MHINPDTGQQTPETLDEALACAEIQGIYIPLYPDYGEFIDASDDERETILAEMEHTQ